MHARGVWTGLAVLAGLGLGWLLAQRAEPVHAQAQIAPAQGLMALLDGPDAGPKLLYVIDPRDRVLCIYDFDVRKNKLRLAAVRHFAADMQLAEFQNEPPTVANIEELVQKR